MNNRTVQVGTAGGTVWAYFGCFLNVYDPGDVVNGSAVQALLAGTHHCLVAEIAYDDAPIVNANGIAASPENSDKLAQRNLQLTLSDNPTQQVLLQTATGVMITIGTAGVTILNGQGASIALVGSSVIINNGALTIT